MGLLEDYGLTIPSESFPPFQPSDCPDGRVIWWTENRKYKAFINFLDHIKFVISLPRGYLQHALRDYMDLVSHVEKILKEKENRGFAWHSKYGYLTSCLADMGTGLHVEVKVRLAMVHKVTSINRRVHYSQTLAL
jgi:protein-arginine kinase